MNINLKCPPPSTPYSQGFFNPQIKFFILIYKQIQAPQIYYKPILNITETHHADMKSKPQINYIIKSMKDYEQTERTVKFESRKWKITKSKKGSRRERPRLSNCQRIGNIVYGEENDESPLKINRILFNFKKRGVSKKIRKIKQRRIEAYEDNVS